MNGKLLTSAVSHNVSIPISRTQSKLPSPYAQLPIEPITRGPKRPIGRQTYNMRPSSSCIDNLESSAGVSHNDSFFLNPTALIGLTSAISGHFSDL
jgi:hypothetical protein